MKELEEYDIRQWFMHVELEQAQDTFRVVQGIIETRQQIQPKRKRRSDAGQQRIELKEPVTTTRFGKPGTNEPHIVAEEHKPK